MTALLVLTVAVLVAIGSLKETSHMRKILEKKYSKVHYLPKAVTALVISAQLSELIRVVEHTTIVEVSAAVLLLALLAATKSGTEGELH